MPELAHAPAVTNRTATGAPHVLSGTRYLAWLYSQPAQQAAFAALCEVESEVAASLREGVDHHVAHARLQWWHDEAERTLRGQPVHPLTRALLQGFAASASSELADGRAGRPDISGFVDTAVWDLASATFETRKELTAYCERWAAAMFETAGAIAASAAGTAISPGWRALGAAVREVELLANLALDAHAGRLRIPLDELERSGVDPKVLSQPPWPAPLAALLRERHLALRATIASELAQIGPEAQVNGRSLMVWASLAWQMSRRAQRALPDTVAPRRYHGLADGWQAWRAARRASTGTLRLD